MAARGIGKLYVLNANKKLESISVKTGLSDGTYTEIVRGKIEEGQDVVVGITTQKPQSSSSPIPTGGGGGRRGF
jgi:HlyD family secretion protein